MAAQSDGVVYDQIVAHIKKQNGPYSSWYCGITQDPKQRLHSDHQVPEENYWWIFRECHSDKDARGVEADLLNLGCDGGSGGGDQDAVFVYAYLKKAGVTNP